MLEPSGTDATSCSEYPSETLAAAAVCASEGLPQQAGSQQQPDDDATLA